MKKLIIRLFTACLVLSFVILFSSCQFGDKDNQTREQTPIDSENESIIIGVPYFPTSFFWFLADGLGYLEEEGLDAEIIIYDNNSENIEAIENNEIDIFGTAYMQLFSLWDSSDPLVAIAAADYSYGGDAIITRKNKNLDSISDLKDGKIAVESGTISEFFLDFVLTYRGEITPEDVEKVNYTVDEATEAFLNNEIDGVVTFEPFMQDILSQSDEAQIIFDSANERGLIMDVCAVRKENLDKNPEKFIKAFRAWFKAIEFYKKSPDEAIKIMADAIEMSPEEFAMHLNGIYIMDLRDNVTAFSIASGFESLYGSGRLIRDFIQEKGLLVEIPEIEVIINDTVVQAVAEDIK
ncbi:transporter substrate-binding domain-containing protein [Candidatus Peregrinibacteria bacterium]|nr:transporter substrate-binding domain-containing protein [Candidatus Peregrinibacteria bacterium]